MAGCLKLYRMKNVTLLIALCLLLLPGSLHAEDGYDLWLRYQRVDDAAVLRTYRQTLTGWRIEGQSPTLDAARQELQTGLAGLLGSAPAFLPQTTITKGLLIAGTPNGSPTIRSLRLEESLRKVNDEGFIIRSIQQNGKLITVITANTDTGVLYGVFHFLKLLQTNAPITQLDIASSPVLKLRVLNHWDNLDRTVERGYAGFSLWNWQTLPEYIDPRYRDYARANASIGINGTVLTNVNANAAILTPEYLEKVAALANVFRPYGIKVYLTARFSAPIEIGKLATADPLDPTVQQWWNAKATEIYRYVPDFGGFLVKANSEGQPGPQHYGRTHADGANMLADAVSAQGGVVIWRAFVYDNNVAEERSRQAYNEFKPLDGKFRKNVLIQVKNGPIDFQPREPFHPLFGAMPATPLMMEFQLTQEYLGFSTHLVYLATMFRECLDTDTFAKGAGSTVTKVIDGSLDQHTLTGMAGVANIGTDRNWCGHPFAQANWYALGRLAWNPTLPAETIATEWIRMTFSNNRDVVSALTPLMLESRETTVNYMTPLGLHHIMGYNHHYGPGPWIKDKPRADWTSVYYHRADAQGLGFDRTATGSNALAQYHPSFQKIYGDRNTTPEKYLLWFHHIPWEYTLKSGKTLWNELCLSYQSGVDGVGAMQKTWASLRGKVDNDRHDHVTALLAIQHKEAAWWRNACLSYFQTFSGKPLPAGVEKPDHDLAWYESLNYPNAPGIRPTW